MSLPAWCSNDATAPRATELTSYTPTPKPSLRASGRRSAETSHQSARVPLSLIRLIVVSISTRSAIENSAHDFQITIDGNGGDAFGEAIDDGTLERLIMSSRQFQCADIRRQQTNVRTRSFD